MSDSKAPLLLVADDEPSTLAVLTAHLSGKGYRILEASDGDQAWELAHEHLPDLVVLDVMMPGMSGWEVCRKIREAVSLAHTGVVMLTGIGENLNEMTSPLYGADAYVDKPFQFGDLDKKIEQTLERRQRGALGRPDHADEQPADQDEVLTSAPLFESEEPAPPAARPAKPEAKPVSKAPAKKAKPKKAVKKAKPKKAVKKAKPKKAVKKAKPKAKTKAKQATKKAKTKPKQAAKKAKPKKAAKKAKTKAKSKAKTKLKKTVAKHAKHAAKKAKAKAKPAAKKAAAKKAKTKAKSKTAKSKVRAQADKTARKAKKAVAQNPAAKRVAATKASAAARAKALIQRAQRAIEQSRRQSGLNPKKR